jgi:hypothetical protein
MFGVLNEYVHLAGHVHEQQGGPPDLAWLADRAGARCAGGTVDVEHRQSKRSGESVQSPAMRADTPFVTQLIETRWTRHGKDRAGMRLPPNQFDRRIGFAVERPRQPEERTVDAR